MTYGKHVSKHCEMKAPHEYTRVGCQKLRRLWYYSPEPWPTLLCWKLQPLLIASVVTLLRLV